MVTVEPIAMGLRGMLPKPEGNSGPPRASWKAIGNRVFVWLLLKEAQKDGWDSNGDRSGRRCGEHGGERSWAQDPFGTLASEFARLEPPYDAIADVSRDRAHAGATCHFTTSAVTAPRKMECSS